MNINLFDLFRRRRAETTGSADDGILDRAVRDWTEAEGARGPETLSFAARRSILRSVEPSSRRAPRLAPLANLFLPTRQMALAGALPALVMALVLGYGWRSQDALEGVHSPANVRAMKHDGDVVFTIANGDGAHRVYRSTKSGEGSWESVETEGSMFRDRLQNEPGLVLYRIE